MMTHKFDYKKSKNLISDKRKKLLPAREILFNLGLKKGDIISLDLGIFSKGFHSDMAVTLPVGKIDPEIVRLIRVTKSL